MKITTQKFILKTFILVFIVLFIDFISGKILDKLYSSTKWGVCHQENYIMTKTNEDLLVFGSSRAAYHYIPSVLKDSLGVTVYNSGREGSGIYYHYGVLLGTLKRYTPKIIFLDIDYRDLYDEFDGIFGVQILNEHYPYYGKISSEFDSLLTLADNKNNILLNSSLYKYNSKFFKILTGNIIRGRGNEQGFRELNGLMNQNIAPLFKSEFKTDRDKLKVLQRFVNKAKERNVILVFTVSPYYMITPHNLYDPLEIIAKENNITILNHFNDIKFLSDRSLFSDELHLNKAGAILFTKTIASNAKKVLNLD